MDDDFFVYCHSVFYDEDVWRFYCWIAGEGEINIFSALIGYFYKYIYVFSNIGTCKEIFQSIFYNRNDNFTSSDNNNVESYLSKDIYKNGIENIVSEIDKYDGIIIGDMPAHERNLILKYCFDKDIRTYSIPKISDVLLRSSEQLTLFDTPLLLSKNDGLLIEQLIIKRLVDIILSCIAVIVTLPLFLIIAVCIKLDDWGPVFYKQRRLTYCGKVFEIYKFRTMIQNAEKKSGPRLAGKEDDRILRVGKVLRRTRLDELPQIYNILKGDMSFVGPRPERPELAQKIEKDLPEFRYRLKVKAGLTGYAQIYGKYNTTSYDKLKLDLTYIRNYSIWLDFKLMILTPKIMLMKESTEGVDSKENLCDKNV